MSLPRLTSHWFNEEGEYVPFRDREPKTVFDRLLPGFLYVMDYVNNASQYLHVYVTMEGKAEELAEFLTENTDFRVSVDHVGHHTYDYFPGNIHIIFRLRL